MDLKSQKMGGTGANKPTTVEFENALRYVNKVKVSCMMDYLQSYMFLI